MIGSLPPGAILIAGATLLPLFPGRLKPALLLFLPALSFAHLLSLPMGTHVDLTFFDYALTIVRVDKLSFAFGCVFHIAAFVGALYALHVKDDVQHVAALVYAGSGIAGAFAGDLVTLFVCWELTAVSSVFLIWSRRTERAYKAGLRYLVIQVGSGVLLLAGIVLHLRDTNSLAFVKMGLTGPGETLIFLAFGIKCAFPFLHNWLQDAYPEATPTGTVFLSAFTTKLAVYALARGFPGTPCLVWIGAVMTVFPVFFAVIENDLRKVLAYSLNNQLGFMVCGIGLAAPGALGDLALNGTVSHAFAHILYKALLFMSMGAILQQAGTVKASELGGLYKSMPVTTVFCLIGAASISAFPLFSGFVTKSMVMSAASKGDYAVTWFALMFASAGVLHHSGIRIPYHGFFGHDAGLRCKEAPLNMLLAMGLTAALCIGIGVYPAPLYRILPNAVDYHPYETGHWVSQCQLLFLALLAFAFLKRRDLEPADVRSVNLDFDWIYRWLAPRVVRWTVVPALAAIERVQPAVGRDLAAAFLGEPGADGRVRPPKAWSASTAVMVAVLALFVYLLIDYWRG